MPDGTAPVNQANDATSGTSGGKLAPPVYVYRVWATEGTQIYPYMSTLSRLVAEATAKSFKGLITREEAMADFRNGGQAA